MIVSGSDVITATSSAVQDNQLLLAGAGWATGASPPLVSEPRGWSLVHLRQSGTSFLDGLYINGH